MVFIHDSWLTASYQSNESIFCRIWCLCPQCLRFRISHDKTLCTTTGFVLRRLLFAFFFFFRVLLRRVCELSCFPAPDRYVRGLLPDVLLPPSVVGSFGMSLLDQGQQKTSKQTGHQTKKASAQQRKPSTKGKGNLQNGERESDVLRRGDLEST